MGTCWGNWSRGLHRTCCSTRTWWTRIARLSHSDASATLFRASKLRVKLTTQTQSTRTCVWRLRTTSMSRQHQHIVACTHRFLQIGLTVSTIHSDNSAGTNVGMGGTGPPPPTLCLTRGLSVTTLSWNSANWARNLANSTSVSGATMVTSATFPTGAEIACSRRSNRAPPPTSSRRCAPPPFWQGVSRCAR